MRMIVTLAMSLFMLLPLKLLAGPCDAHFAFDDDLNDSGGNGYNGRMIGREGVKASPQFVAGKYGQALELDGTSAMRAFVDLHFDICPAVTVTAWIRVSGEIRKGVQELVSTGSGSGPGIRVSGANLILKGSANGIIQRNAIRPNAGWMFVAGAYDYANETYTLYWRNRAVAKEMGTSRKAPDEAIWVGAFNDGLAGASTNIVIDDLRIYGRLLSQEEIRKLGVGPASAVIPQPVAGVSDRFQNDVLNIPVENSPTDILDAMRTPLSRAQIVLDSQGAIAYLSVGVNATAPWGNVYFKSTVLDWAESSKRITEIAGVPGQGDVVSVAEYSEYDYFPKEAHLERGVIRQIRRAIGNGERVDLVALPPSAATEMSYLLITDQKVYSRLVSQAAVQIAENALAAGDEITAVVFPTNNSFAMVTSGGVFTANLPTESNLGAHLLQLHQAGERIEDIVIHPKGFGWSGETGSYVIATDRQIIGVHVSCNSFDQVREWAQQNSVPRQITCDGDRPQQVADDIPIQTIPDLDLKDNQCEWGFRGTISVHHGLPFLVGELGKSPLAGIDVKVSGSVMIGEQWGPWNGWSTVRTDEYGRFVIRKAKGCGRRQIRLAVKFQDDEIEVRHKRSTSSLTKVKWYEIDRIIGNGGLIIVDDYELGLPSDAHGVLVEDGAEMWWHADIWVLYKKVIDLMRSHGAEYAFKKKIKIKYPHDGIAPDERETSYANPENGVIYITSKGSFENFTVDTLIHELGHIWSYQHSADSYNMATPLVGVKRLSCLTLGFLRGVKFQTHGMVADRCVAFYEGFAEYFKDHVLFELFAVNSQACRDGDGDSVDDCPGSRPEPFSRAYLGAGPGTSNPPAPVRNIEDLQHHDMGWYSALNTLTDFNRGRHEYGTLTSGGATPDWFVGPDFSSSCAAALGPNLNFWDILRAFSPGSGHNTYFRPIRLADERSLPILASFNDTRLDNFLDRVAAVTGKMTPADVQSMRRMIDPAESVEAWDLYCP